VWGNSVKHQLGHDLGDAVLTASCDIHVPRLLTG
jgi:hypothetical protein